MKHKKKPPKYHDGTILKQKKIKKEPGFHSKPGYFLL